MRAIIISTFFLLNSLYTVSVYAQSAGPNSPSNSAISGSGANFPALFGIYAPGDNNVAYTDLADYPVCTNGFNCFYSKSALISGFGFSIPATASVTGIEVKLRKMISNPLPNIKDSVVQLLKGALPVGLNYANNIQWPNSLTYVAYGDSTNLWGTTWTPAEINDPSFGIRLLIKNTDFGQLAQFDHATIKVFYTLPSGEIELTENAGPEILISASQLTVLSAASYYGNRLDLVNILGETILTVPKFQGDVILLSGIKEGVYFLRMQNKKGVFYSKKIAIR